MTFNNQQQKKCQDTLCYCWVVASSAFIMKKLQDSPLLSIISCEIYTALHRSHSIWRFYWNFWDNLLSFNSVCIRQNDCTMFSSTLHFPVNLWLFICSTDACATTSEDCKNYSIWLLNSSHIWKADPQPQHIFTVLDEKHHIIECRQATRVLLKRRQCSLCTVR